MKKNLWDPATAEAVIERLKLLKPDSGNHWGKMQVTEMLLHCTLANNFMFDDETAYQRPTIVQRVKQFICFNYFARLPRNRIGPKRLESRHQTNERQFEEQQNAAIISVERFTTHQRPIKSLHAGLGWLSRKQWGLIAYMHMDHHLRQFGV